MSRHTTHSHAEPMIERLEQRQMLAVSPIIAGTKIKTLNVFSNGVNTNTSLITIPFTGNVHLGDLTKIRVYGYAINPLSSHLAQVKVTIHVSNVQVLATDFNHDGVMEH